LSEISLIRVLVEENESLIQSRRVQEVKKSNGYEKKEGRESVARREEKEAHPGEGANHPIQPIYLACSIQE